MQKLLVINGCGHSSGSEIADPPSEDGPDCRNNNFGILLAKLLGRKPIQLSMPNASNDWIARTTAAWVGDHIEEIRNKSIDVVFLIHWTQNQKWEFRFPEDTLPTTFVNYHHDCSYKSVRAEISDTEKGFLKKLSKWFTRIFVEDLDFWSDNKIKNIVFLQELLKNNDCKYWFGDIENTFRPTLTYHSLSNFIDRTYFPYFENNSMSFVSFQKNNNSYPRENSLYYDIDSHKNYARFLFEELKKAGLE